MTRTRLLLLAALAAHPSALPAQAAPDSSRKRADSVRLITSDIANFWRAYALAAGKDSAERVRIFQTVYLQPGSAGLRDVDPERLLGESGYAAYADAQPQR